MRAALLSAGPKTLGLYPGPSGFDLVIGVNTAATLYPCDHWSCADHDRFLEIKNVIGTPDLLMIDAERDRIIALDPERLAQHTARVWSEIWPVVGADPRYKSSSAEAALVLAKYLGASSVVCYGVDMDGPADVTGQVTKHRNPKRWEKERRQFADLSRWMIEQGMQVERVAA